MASLLLIAVLAACGSDSNESSSATTTSTTPSAEGNVVRIGVIAPIDDGLTEFGSGIVNSVQLRVDQANAADAIPGWTLEVVAVDDSSDPDVGAANISQLIDDPTVVGVVGPYNSGVAEAILPAMDAAGLALISPSNTLASLTLGDDPAAPVRPYDNYFRLVASDADQAPFLATSAYGQADARTVAVVSETKAVSSNLASDFATSFTGLGGTITTQTVVPDGNEDFSAFLAEALTTQPDLIFFGGEYDVAASLRTQATAAGFTGAIMGGDGIKDASYIEATGDDGIGTWASSVGAPLAELDTASAYVAAYDAAGFDEPPTDYGPFAYDAAGLIIEALIPALADQDSLPADIRATVIAAVQASEVPEASSGPLGFDEFGDTINRVFTLYRVADDSGTLVWDVVGTTT